MIFGMAVAGPVNLEHLTHFMPLISFDIPRKHQKTRGFLIFSVDIKRDQWYKMVKDSTVHMRKRSFSYEEKIGLKCVQNAEENIESKCYKQDRKCLKNRTR